VALDVFEGEKKYIFHDNSKVSSWPYLNRQILWQVSTLCISWIFPASPTPTPLGSWAEGEESALSQMQRIFPRNTSECMYMGASPLADKFKGGLILLPLEISKKI
jgi:hypothetical protein